MTTAEGLGGLLLRNPANAEQAPVRPTHAQATSLSEVEALVPAYSALLFRVAHAIVRDRAEAEDVVQDTFLRVLAHRHELAAVREMRVWLVRIAWRLAVDRHRRITPGQMDEAFAHTLAGSHLPADRALIETNEVRQVLREIDRLPGKEREVLLLCAVEEMTFHEVAAVIGRSESAVRALLHRARERLKQRLAKAQEGRQP